MAGPAVGHRGVASRLAKLALQVAICRVHRNRRFSERMRDELPHASCVDKGHRTERQTNAVQVAGLGRICFQGALSFWLLAPSFTSCDFFTWSIGTARIAVRHLFAYNICRESLCKWAARKNDAVLGFPREHFSSTTCIPGILQIASNKN
jgi:hypothetical protein